MIRRVLVVPLLAPWALVLLVAVLNPSPRLSLRLLVWRSAPLPIGTWLALVSSAGAVVSLSATALALQGRGAAGQGGWPGVGRFSARRRVQRSSDAWEEPSVSGRRPPVAPPASAGPARAPGEPAPTVSVPFRVIRRGSADSAGVRATAAAPAPGVSAERQPSAGRAWAPFAAVRSRVSAQPTAQAGAEGDGWDDRADDDW